MEIGHTLELGAGEYTVVSIASRGHFGSVYKVKSDNDKYYALKEILRGEHTVKIGFKQFKITAEENAQLVSNEHHVLLYLNKFNLPWFPRYYGLYESKTSYLLLSEWINGVPIDKVRLECTECIAIIKQLFECIFWLHYQGLIHGDLNPQNIIVDNAKQIKIIDFGLSCGNVSLDCSKLSDLRYNRDFKELRIRDLIRLKAISINLISRFCRRPYSPTISEYELELSDIKASVGYDTIRERILSLFRIF